MVAQVVDVLFYAAYANVFFAISLLRIVLLYLFKIAFVRAALAFAYGKGAIAKVDEHFAALQIVHGERPGLRLGVCARAIQAIPAKAKATAIGRLISMPMKKVCRTRYYPER